MIKRRSFLAASSAFALPVSALAQGLGPGPVINNTIATNNSNITATGAATSQTLAHHFQKPYDARDYGAIGDGSSHPLSGVTSFGGQNTTGWTLTQWQAIFSFATATSNELDSCAHQLAINTANANGGGLVLSPSGHYRHNMTITLPNTTAPLNATPTNSVSWEGEGRESTIHEWSTDLGSGNFAVTCTNRTSSGQGSFGTLAHMTFVGPNNSVAVGSSPANMHGIGGSSGRVFNFLRLVGFKGALCVCNDQTRHHQLEFYNNFYSIYYDNFISGTLGDIDWYDIRSDLSKKATIGIANNTVIASTNFHRLTAATTPYVFFKETGGSNNLIFDQGVHVFKGQFEQIGNAIISDGLAAGSHVATISDHLIIEDCEYGPSSTYNIAANPATGLICCHQTFGPITIRVVGVGGSNWTFTGTTSGIFEIDFPSAGLILEGDLTSLFSQLGSTAIAKGNINAADFRLKNFGFQGWDGRVFPANGTPTVAIGNVIACDTGGGGFAGLSGGTATEQILGIAVQATSGGAPIAVAQSGYAATVLAGSNVIGNGTIAHSGASGRATATTTGPKLGIWGNGSGTSPNLKGSIFLQGIE